MSEAKKVSIELVGAKNIPLEELKEMNDYDDSVVWGKFDSIKSTGLTRN